ncbi:hypothetical protein B0T25DRAFT_546513 [Lasiosphaeria hispida]|uniref:Uncharacterized protein n=1 Tax=Lasiosphaeria hispida TaxID=260671 RepID=A0AAJ0HE16_9PEZI|nr:hypothetical protein B0T25DRAFT_546513 [Lasiosphaeria hispida]
MGPGLNHPACFVHEDFLVVAFLGHVLFASTVFGRPFEWHNPRLDIPSSWHYEQAAQLSRTYASYDVKQSRLVDSIKDFCH